MSQVPKGKQKEGKLLVSVMAREMVVHTLQITANEKVFIPKFQTALTNRIIDTSIQIHKCIWSANNINVCGNDSEYRYKCRKRLQEQAINECENLLALIDIAKPLFHIEGRRIVYWSKLVINVKVKTQSWKESDTKRYENIAKNIGM